MDEVSVLEIVRGLMNDSMKSQRLQLLQLLANKLAESTEPLTADECKAVFAVGCLKVQGETEGSLIHLGLTILANATINEDNAEAFVEFIKKSDKYGSHFKSFANTFLDHNPQVEFDNEQVTDWSSVDPWQCMGSVFCNLCQAEEGRVMILRQSNRYMVRMLDQIRSKNVVRRRGVVGCVRTCLFDKDIHWWMVVDAGCVDHLVLPLITPTPFTDVEKKGMNPILWMQAERPEKIVEPDHDLLTLLLECVQLLCQRRGLREELRKRRVYIMIKNLDLQVEDEKQSEIIYQIVDLLMGDEDPRTKIDKYGEDATAEDHDIEASALVPNSAPSSGLAIESAPASALESAPAPLSAPAPASAPASESVSEPESTPASISMPESAQSQQDS
ncbi:hypothetical protein B484DRAFT_164038 [Ochromonadaceae sp. CCMP2298]|nr:hypothetical protein B484DRAFT_164038 [Ochromonadaceae sp. CCMP2298]|mmetsp:Transcript_23592/g.52403  ORF Transcript_23592/g.52403 Transcript_23592/m.52403 type:complete len:387 (+) Transcript_23592:116-1276(+)